MTRRWVDTTDERWIMACDREGCTTVSEPSERIPDLTVFAQAGWFVARLWGDRCPACVVAGMVEKVEPYQGLPSPIDVVTTL